MESLLTYAQESSEGTSTISVIFNLASIVGLWMMFQKANEPGWKAIIPFYNEYTLCKKVMGDPWYWLRLFVVIIPVIGWIAFLYFEYQIGKATARAYGQPDSWAWGYTFLSPVFYCITGFGSYSYYGPMGIGDTRTHEARGARTVDFDVTKNETPAAPEATAAPAGPEVKTAHSEEAVDFEFSQTDDAAE